MDKKFDEICNLMVPIFISGETMAECSKDRRREMCQNFLKQFKDKDTNAFKNLTAEHFLEIWSHYDTDNNGYIEGKELDSFLREFIASNLPTETTGELIPEKAVDYLRNVFMDMYDENSDDRIEISELVHMLPVDETFQALFPIGALPSSADFMKLAEILPMEENFLFLFRNDNPLASSVEFMQVWKRFDKDKSGYIEADELKSFLQYLLKEARKDADVTEEQLIQYTDTMLQLFDRNKDGKLQLSEMAKLLPVKENFLCRPMFRSAVDAKVTRKDIDRVFYLYDRDQNGSIENEELSGFLKDLLELIYEDFDEDDLESCKRAILKGCDRNCDGKIDKDELTMILLQYSTMTQ